MTDDPARGDHPHSDPGDGRTECETCGKFVWPVTHSCKRVPVTAAARARAEARHAGRAPVGWTDTLPCNDADRSACPMLATIAAGACCERATDLDTPTTGDTDHGGN